LQRCDDRGLKFGSVELNEIPDDPQIHFFIGVDDPVARRVDLCKRDFGMAGCIFRRVGKNSACCFSDDAEVPQDRILQHPVSHEGRL